MNNYPYVTPNVVKFQCIIGHLSIRIREDTVCVRFSAKISTPACVLKVNTRHGESCELSVTAEVRARIEGCQDLEVLQHWLARAVTTVSADQIFEG